MSDRLNELLTDFTAVISKLRKAEETIVLDNVSDDVLAELLVFLNPETSAAFLAMQTPERQVSLIKKIVSAEGAEIALDTLHEIKESLNNNLNFEKDSVERFVGDRNRIAAQILNYGKPSTERHVLNAINDIDEELAENIRKKLFIFSDLLILKPRDLQVVLQEVDYTTLAIALSAADEEIKQFVFSNLSQNTRKIIQDDIDYMGPIRLVDQEEAREKISKEVLFAQECGNIIIER